jgi:hypothetical protein
MAGFIRHGVDVDGLTSNLALERTAGSHSLAAAGQRERSRDLIA